jgi:hypothetical protein
MAITQIPAWQIQCQAATWMAGVRFQAQSVQTASEAKPISYPSGNVSYLSTVKVPKRKIH